MNDNHSDAFVLSLPLVLPSANFYLHLHWRRRYDLGEVWHNAVWALCNLNRVYPCDKLHLECTIYFKEKRKRDPANFVTPLDKLVFDGLTRCGILVDDDAEHLTWSVPVLAVDSAKPRTEVILTPEK